MRTRWTVGTAVAALVLGVTATATAGSFPLGGLASSSTSIGNLDVQSVPGPQPPPANPVPPSAALAKVLARLPPPSNIPVPAGPLATTGGSAMPGSAVTPSATAGGGYWSCDQTWEWVAATIGGYVIGNCESGAHLHRTEYSVGYQGYTWDGGQIFGDFGGNCGWLHSDQFIGDGTFSHCSDADTPAADYIYQYPSGTYHTWTSKNGMDGVLLNNTQAGGCPEYAEYYPWTPSRETDYTGVTAPQNSDRLLIRYLALYPSGDGSGKYFMVRDSSIASGSGNWVFVPADCF